MNWCTYCDEPIWHEDHVFVDERDLRGEPESFIHAGCLGSRVADEIFPRRSQARTDALRTTEGADSHSRPVNSTPITGPDLVAGSATPMTSAPGGVENQSGEG